MPNTWPLVPLGDIALPVERPETPLPGTIYRQVGVKLWGQGAYEREPMDGAETKYRSLSRVEAGDIIVNKIWARNGSVAVVSDSLAGSYVSSEFPTFTPTPGKLDPEWFHWFTKTPNCREQCDDKSRGTSGKNRIKPERFLEIEIPLPPLDEQRRIVTRIEALAAKIEEAGNLRGQSSTQVAFLRMAALREIIEDNSSAIGTLGRGLLAAKNGLSRRPMGIESGPIVLRLADVSGGVICLANPRRGSLSEEEIRDYSLSRGELLFVRVNGSLEIVGGCIPFEGADETVCFNDHLIRARIDPNIFDWRYVSATSNGPFARDYIQGVSITTAGQFTINQSMLAGVPIPLIPLPEQRRIVAYLDGLQAKVDALKKLQAETAAELDALLPSVLDRAFKGEL